MALAAKQQITVTPSGPPDIPSMPAAPDGLSDYLRRFATWANVQLQGKVPAQTASGYLMLQSPGNNIFKVTVSDTGVLTTTQVTPGMTKP